MGKHHKKSRTHVKYISSPDEENRKIRDSILAEFRNHFQTEDNAKSVAHPNGKDIQSQGSTLHSVIDRYSLADSDASMESQEDVVRRKRRKTKAERNKARSKSASSKNDAEKKADVSKHIRTAHNVSYPLRSKVQKDDSFSAITQNRLTKKLGLFNKVKKSSTASREPIVLTESVRKQTEDDLKKILSMANDRCEVSMETDHGASGVTSEQESIIPSASLYEPPKALITITPISLGKSNHSHTLSSTSTGISTCPSSIEFAEDFPETPPMDDIVQLLAEKLEDHKIFKGRDIAKELCDDLNKLMKHNAPREGITPASIRIRSDVLTSGGSSSVCRSLIDSFTPHSEGQHSSKSSSLERNNSKERSHPSHQEQHVIPHNQDKPKPYSQVVKIPASSTQSKQHVSSPGNMPQGVSARKASSIKDLALIAQVENIASRVKQSFKTSDLDSVRMNAMDLLKHNNQIGLKREVSCTVSKPTKAPPLTEALDLLAQNDKVLKLRIHQEMETSAQSNKENVHNQVDCLESRSFSSQEHLINSQSSGFHSHHSSEITLRRPILNQMLCGSDSLDRPRHSPRTSSDVTSMIDQRVDQESHQAVLAEYCEDTQYMPKFHGDFYKDSLWFEKTILSNIEQIPDPQQLAGTNETDPSSMDILDYLDHGSQASMDILPSSGHSNYRSPSWPSSSNPYLLPPRSMSPDSPQMFPRRLY